MEILVIIGYLFYALASLAVCVGLLSCIKHIGADRVGDFIAFCIITLEFIVIMHILSEFFELDDFHLGHLLYSSMVSTYQLLSNSYAYYCISAILFSASHIFPEIRGEYFYEEYFTFIAQLLIISYFLALPTFSLYSSIPSAMIPFAYLYILYQRFYNEGFEYRFNKLKIYFGVVGIGYLGLREIDQERFIVFTIEVLFMIGTPIAAFLVVPDIYSEAYNYNYPRIRNSVNYNGVYNDMEIVICIIGGMVSLLLTEEILEVLYSGIPLIYYLMIVYGYSVILDILYSLYSKDLYMFQGKHLLFFMLQLVLIKYTWVCFISPYLPSKSISYY